MLRLPALSCFSSPTASMLLHLCAAITGAARSWFEDSLKPHTLFLAKLNAVVSSITNLCSSDVLGAECDAKMSRAFSELDATDQALSH